MTRHAVEVLDVEMTKYTVEVTEVDEYISVNIYSGKQLLWAEEVDSLFDVHKIIEEYFEE